LPGDTDLVVIPGSKNTRADLVFLRAQGWEGDIHAHVRRGGWVMGLCGGYQMLGKIVSDPAGIEGPAGDTTGLGLLDIITVMAPDKRLTRVAGSHAASGTALTGYEIHIGQSDGPDRGRPFAWVAGQAEGAVSPDGRIIGTYLHGLLGGDRFRRAFLASLGVSAGPLSYAAEVDHTLNALADHLEAHMDVAGLLALAQQV